MDCNTLFSIVNQHKGSVYLGLGVGGWVLSIVKWNRPHTCTGILMLDWERSRRKQYFFAEKSFIKYIQIKLLVIYNKNKLNTEYMNTLNVCLTYHFSSQVFGSLLFDLILVFSLSFLFAIFNAGTVDSLYLESLCLELLFISNKNFGRMLIFLSLSRTFQPSHSL